MIFVVGWAWWQYVLLAAGVYVAGLFPGAYLVARIYGPDTSEGKNFPGELGVMFWPITMWYFVLGVIAAPLVMTWKLGLQQHAFAKSRKKKEIDR